MLLIEINIDCRIVLSNKHHSVKYSNRKKDIEKLETVGKKLFFEFNFRYFDFQTNDFPNILICSYIYIYISYIYIYIYKVKNRKIFENHGIIPTIIPSLYTKEIAKHTNINWNYRNSILRVFWDDEGDFEPDIELLFNAFSHVNDNKYKEYSTYLKKINIFLDHPLNYIYKNDPELNNFWQKQEVIESLNILNIAANFPPNS